MAATEIAELIPMFLREVNPPGFEQFPDIGGGDSLGYIEDGFWDAKLSGLLGSYTVADGSEIVPVGTTGTKYFTDSSTKEEGLDTEFWMLIIVFAGFRLLRLKTMNLAVNLRAHAGPVEYEQQASATVLRAILQSLERRVKELKEYYSTLSGSGMFVYFDGEIQREYSIIDGLPSLSAL